LRKKVTEAKHRPPFSFQQKTKAQKSSLDPVFNESFDFKLENKETSDKKYVAQKKGKAFFGPTRN